MKYRLIAIVIMSTVFPHILAGTQVAVCLDKELSEWKGLPVNVSADSSDSLLAIEGSFSIKKNEAYSACEEENLSIAAADSTGILNGIFFLLRAQQQRDTCLCITLPHYDTVRILPLFSRRVVEYDYNLIINREKSHSLSEMARHDAMAGINGWFVTEGDLSSGNAAEMEELKKTVAPYGISLYKDRESLGTTVLVLSDSGNMRFMAEIWQEQMRKAYQDGCSVILYRPEPPVSEHPMREINLYAFGRLSSDSSINPRRIAYEWLAKTYSDNPLIVQPLMESLINADEASFCTKVKEFGTY